MSSTLWDGLVARYCPSLDTDGNGTTTLHNLDGNGAEVGSNDGTLTNMNAATDWVVDTDNGGVRALDFDGVNDYVSTTYDPSFVQNTRVFTASFWIKRTGANRDFAISTTTAAANKGFFAAVENIEGVGLNAARFVMLRGVSGSTLEYRSPDSTVSTSDWAHLVFVGDGSNVAIYIDGVSQTVTTHHNTAGGTWANPTGASTQNLDVGIAGFLSGRIDDVCIFNVAKSATDIALLYHSRGIKGTEPRINRGLINVSR